MQELCRRKLTGMHGVILEDTRVLAAGAHLIHAAFTEQHCWRLAAIAAT
ncbi:hypothetical protein KCP73_17890 [Salmonella enterica subsp. enterica]|nr:hypothetical protein KCP73_17890 [Salmonella enterica subsp. enterica]